MTAGIFCTARYSCRPKGRWSERLGGLAAVEWGGKQPGTPCPDSKRITLEWETAPEQAWENRAMVLYHLAPNCWLCNLYDRVLSEEGTRKLYKLFPAFSKPATKLRKWITYSKVGCKAHTLYTCSNNNSPSHCARHCAKCYESRVDKFCQKLPSTGIMTMPIVQVRKQCRGG